MEVSGEITLTCLSCIEDVVPVASGFVMEKGDTPY